VHGPSLLLGMQVIRPSERTNTEYVNNDAGA